MKKFLCEGFQCVQICYEIDTIHKRVINPLFIIIKGKGIFVK